MSASAAAVFLRSQARVSAGSVATRGARSVAASAATAAAPSSRRRPQFGLGADAQVLGHDDQAPITQPSVLPVIPERGSPFEVAYTQWNYLLDGDYSMILEE